MQTHSCRRRREEEKSQRSFWTRMKTHAREPPRAGWGALRGGVQMWGMKSWEAR